MGHDYHRRQRLAVAPEFKCPKKKVITLYGRAGATWASDWLLAFYIDQATIIKPTNSANDKILNMRD